jgi:hypothetical protein
LRVKFQVKYQKHGSGWAVCQAVGPPGFRAEGSCSGLRADVNAAPHQAIRFASPHSIVVPDGHAGRSSWRPIRPTVCRCTCPVRRIINDVIVPARRQLTRYRAAGTVRAPLSSHPCLPCCWSQCKQQGRFAPRTLLRFVATTGPAATLSPFPPISRCSGYTASLCSADFAAGRGGLLQLLGASLSSCCRYHPAGMDRRFGQISTVHVAFAPSRRARPPECTFSGPPMRLLSLRPDDSLTIHRMALSIDFPDSVSFLLTIQATGFLTLSLAGLTPAEYTSLRWTYPDGHPCQYTFCSP